MDWRIGDINWWGVVDSRKENGWPSWCSAITLTGTTGDAYFLCWECGMKYLVRCIHKIIYWIYGSRSGSCFFHSSLIPQYRVFWYCISFPRQDCLECPCISVQSSGRSRYAGHSFQKREFCFKDMILPIIPKYRYVLWLQFKNETSSNLNYRKILTHEISFRMIALSLAKKNKTDTKDTLLCDAKLIRWE